MFKDFQRCLSGVHNVVKHQGLFKYVGHCCLRTFKDMFNDALRRFSPLSSRDLTELLPGEVVHAAHEILCQGYRLARPPFERMLKISAATAEWVQITQGNGTLAAFKHR
jgi:hypothetical protein